LLLIKGKIQDYTPIANFVILLALLEAPEKLLLVRVPESLLAEQMLDGDRDEADMRNKVPY
jgi:hypothetical protein